MKTAAAIALMAAHAQASLDTLSRVSLSGDRHRRLTRAITTDTPGNVSALNNYGCWCYFEVDNYHRGKGKHIDSYDALCKKYNQGMECISLDLGGSGCEPWVQAYTAIPNLSLSALGLAVVDIEQACIDENPGDQCAQTVCHVESKFIHDITVLVSTGTSTDINLFHEVNGVEQFNPDAEVSPGVNACDVVEGPPSEKSCCGDYPNRIPYRVISKECCADGSSQIIGQC